MRIKEIISQHRRDFRALYICESCNFEEVGQGYDDHHFHNNVIPSWECKHCGKQSPSDYQPRIPKYGANEII